jgi:ATP-dependent Lon protease
MKLNLNISTESVRHSRERNSTFQYEFDQDLHSRSIVTDTGWRILLDRGLDICPHESSNVMDLDHHLQQFRKVRSFNITYMRTE